MTTLQPRLRITIDKTPAAFLVIFGCLYFTFRWNDTWKGISVREGGFHLIRCLYKRRDQTNEGSLKILQLMDYYNDL